MIPDARVYRFIPIHACYRGGHVDKLSEFKEKFNNFYWSPDAIVFCSEMGQNHCKDWFVR